MAELPPKSKLRTQYRQLVLLIEAGHSIDRFKADLAKLQETQLKILKNYPCFDGNGRKFKNEQERVRYFKEVTGFKQNEQMIKALKLICE